MNPTLQARHAKLPPITAWKIASSRESLHGLPAHRRVLLEACPAGAFFAGGLSSPTGSVSPLMIAGAFAVNFKEFPEMPGATIGLAARTNSEAGSL